MRWNELGDSGTMKANGTNNGDFPIEVFMFEVALAIGSTVTLSRTNVTVRMMIFVVRYLFMRDAFLRCYCEHTRA